MQNKKKEQRVFVMSESLIGDFLMQTPTLRVLKSKYDRVFLVTQANSTVEMLALQVPAVDHVLTPAEASILAEKSDQVFTMDANKAFISATTKGTQLAAGFASCCDIESLTDLSYDFKLNMPTQTIFTPAELSKVVLCGRHSVSCESNDNGKPANKCFDNAVWVEIANWLISLGYNPVAIGTPQDAADTRYSEWPGQLMYDQPLENILQLQQKCAFTMTVDTGLRHTATAVGGNLLTISGAIGLDLISMIPTNPKQIIKEYVCAPSLVTFDFAKECISSLLKENSNDSKL